MKILYAADFRIPSKGAYSVHVMKMAEAISEIGHDVTLLLPNIQSALPEVSNIYKHYAVKDNFQIQRLPWHNIPAKRLLFAKRVTSYSKREGFDLIYTRSLQIAFMAVHYKIPCIYENHSPVSNSGKFNNWLFKKILTKKSLQFLVVITKALEEYYLQKYSLQNNFVIVAPDAASDDLASNAEVPINRNQDLQVGYIGHLYKGRGIPIILELAKECPWATFHLVGGIESDIQHWKNETKELKNIIFHGYVAPSRTGQYRRSFDVLIAPYEKKVTIYNDNSVDNSKWMSPLKIFEYMSTEKPIIASDNPAIKEVLTHEKTALLCDPDDLKSWVEALTRIKNDSKLRESLSKNSRSEYQQKYTWIIRAKNITRLCKT